MSGTDQLEPNASEDDPWISLVVGERYRIDARIGQGGMGVIYRGHHLELGKRVAVKRLDARIASDPSSFERFRREAIAASRIESPHVVHVFDWGKAADGSPYLVMELLDGCDLRQLFVHEGRLVPEQATTILAQVLRALIHTHQAQIIHRDLKPENIFLCRYEAEEPYVKVLDFGISKQVSLDPPHTNVTRTGVVLGTASYMSPEQAKGDATIDVRSDLYSVGAILFEALTGRVPHRGRTYEATLFEICTRDADDVRLHAPLVSEPLARVVARALARDPALRFQSARQFLDALSDAVPNLSRSLLDSAAEPRPQPRFDTVPSSSLGTGQFPRTQWRRVGTVVALLFAVAVSVVLVVRLRSTAGKEASRGEPLHSAEPRSEQTARVSPPALSHDIPATVATGPNAMEAMAATEPSPATPTRAPNSAGPRQFPQRQEPYPSHAPTGNTVPPGVAAGLRLRRSMP
ncbi:MAG: protein kinase domain-containing protein [Myxococcales bacterium]